jgi:cbb3-type cytochrome oxidase subunit 3
MENSNRKIPFNTKLGFVSGPLMMAMGAYFINQGKQMGIGLIVLGLIRLGLTAWLYVKHPKNTGNR